MTYNSTNEAVSSRTFQSTTAQNIEPDKNQSKMLKKTVHFMRSFIKHLAQKFKPNDGETEPSKKQAKKKKRRSKTTINSPENMTQITQGIKSEPIQIVVQNILGLLAEGKTEQALDAHSLNSKHKNPGKSRFLDGLNFAATNKRKALWISSFCGDTKAKPQPNQEIVVKFTPFQYWSQGKLPHDIQDIQKKWDKIFLEIGLPTIKVFDKTSAGEWISSHAPEFIKIFEKAPLYAVEADIFRIAFALHNDCIWIDSDQYPRQNTGQLIQQRANHCDTLLMYRWNRPWITNSFFLTKKNSPLFQKIFNTSLSYKLPKTRTLTRNDVLRSFGPGRYNTVLNTIIKESSIHPKANSLPKAQWTSKEGWRYTFLNEKNLCALKPPYKLSYESSESSWHNHVE